MRPLLQSVTLVTFLIALAACDDVSPGSQGGDIPTGPVPTLDQSAPRDQEIPPGDPVHDMPVDRAQAAPRDAEQSPPKDVNAPSGGSRAVTPASCTAMCSQVVALGCGGSGTCTTLCSQIDAAPGCQSQASALMSCASSAQDCDGLDACETAFESFASCANLDDLTNDPPPTTAPTNYTIRDSACSASNYCQGCASASCDQCICAAQVASSTASEIAAMCGGTCG